MVQSSIGSEKFLHFWYEFLSQAFDSGLAPYHLNVSLTIELCHEEKAD